jgi:hypothetical protein
MSTLTTDLLRSETERLKGVISGLLNPEGTNIDEFLSKLRDAGGNPVRLNNLLGVVEVIDRDYHTLPAGSFPGHGTLATDQFFAPILGDREAGNELKNHLADCVNRLRQSRSDLVERYSRLFS